MSKDDTYDECLIFLQKRGEEMTRCFKVVDEKGRVFVPMHMRELCDIDKNDVVQLMVCGNVLLINKARVDGKNPVEVIKNAVSKEEEERKNERAKLEEILQKFFSNEATSDEIFDVLLNFREEVTDEGYKNSAK